ncbi:GH32 C-terminal domain-containing protein [Liquorilactobacillus uvarum]|uniref:GH32 C-terminal domain-containing protein n=1 Tax=Liquorilactobacillus uvarum TaxID=303240 RepID=UPI003B8A6269
MVSPLPKTTEQNVQSHCLLNKALELDVFFDNSVCKIFVNNVLNVCTLRMFPKADQNNIILESDRGINYNGTWWNLKKSTKKKSLTYAQN